ncbi:unnamed protein product [Adineta ricciae]|uniref:Uncharacterized protein n=1 Tax=Adineta ricciae TaxID=249248 RepID=A0A814PY28_ADIRI|nr:unnamed protein product [Adineta ricciae]
MCVIITTTRQYMSNAISDLEFLLKVFFNIGTQMSENFWNTVRNEIDRTRPPIISQVYDGLYSVGASTGKVVNNCIASVEKVSPTTASMARVARAAAEDYLPMFQDNR